MKKQQKTDCFLHRLRLLYLAATYLFVFDNLRRIAQSHHNKVINNNKKNNDDDGKISKLSVCASGHSVYTCQCVCCVYMRAFFGTASIAAKIVGSKLFHGFRSINTITCYQKQNNRCMLAQWGLEVFIFCVP